MTRRWGRGWTIATISEFLIAEKLRAEIPNELGLVGLVQAGDSKGPARQDPFRKVGKGDEGQAMA